MSAHTDLKYILVPDTTILFCNDRTKIVNATFEKFWQNFSQEIELILLVPYVVKGEILRQNIDQAKTALIKATEEVDKIRELTEHDYKLKISHAKINSKIFVRFDKWLRQKGGAVVEVPIEEINWNNLIEDAIWKRKTFENVKETSGANYEGGFKDALILEILKRILKEYHHPHNVAFICKDKLLTSISSVPTYLQEGQLVTGVVSFDLGVSLRKCL